MFVGGVGLNLTAANRLYLLDPAWNPSTEEQCFDRIHRLGQTKNVEVVKFVMKDRYSGDTDTKCVQYSKC